MAAGKAYKVIARELGISYKAVEGRRARIMRKMKVDNLSELLRQVLTLKFSGAR
jgi:FixJ family two-component response regulator